MFKDNIDDWKIVKEYKQQKRNELANERRRTIQVGKRASKKKPEAESAIQQLEATIAGSGMGLRKMQLKRELKAEQTLLSDIDHDIAKADEIDLGHQAEIDKLNAEINEIDQVMKNLRHEKHEQRKAALDAKQKPVQDCPKKCRISNVVVGCKHGRAMEVPAFDGKVPTLHVLSGSSNAKQDIVDISFGGSCDHGKSQSAGDSETYKQKDRAHGADQYCPRTVVSNASSGTDIRRPNKTRFLTQTDEVKSNSTPVGFLFNHLIFNKLLNDSDLSYEAAEYDVAFESCEGVLPYKALVVAHPQLSWKVDFGFEYKPKASNLKVSAKEEDLDGFTTSGGWSSTIKAEFEYDVYKDTIESALDFKSLLEEVKGSWDLLEKLSDFFEPVNGFVEAAQGYAKDAETEMNEQSTEAKHAGSSDKKKDIAKCEVNTAVKLTGNYARKEGATNHDIYGQGKITVGFSPLFEIKGRVDIVQILAQSLGGGFGGFLREVSNMSVGYKDDNNKLDKKRSYIETNLELLFGGSGRIDGAVSYLSGEENGWQAANDGTGIKAFCGLTLEGKAKVEGKVWRVTLGAGAEFKTTDEGGTKQPGVQFLYTPVVVDNTFTWLGFVEFTGLAVVWAVYYNVGAEGAIDEDENAQKKSRDRFAKIKSKAHIKREVKSEGSHILFKKRLLAGRSDVNRIGA